MARGYALKKAGVRATFREAGGTDVYASHPYLIGQLKGGDIGFGAGTILLTSGAELDSEFVTIRPMQDASKMKITVSGDTVITTNNVPAGTVEFRFIETTGEVATGDPVACFNAVRDQGDTQGWVFEIHSYVNGKKHITKLFGCALQNMPRHIYAGNDVPTYDATFYYSNITEEIGADDDSSQEVWFAGNKTSVSGIFTPFAESQDTSEDPISASSAYGSANSKTASGDSQNGYSGKLDDSWKKNDNDGGLNGASFDEDAYNG